MHWKNGNGEPEVMTSYSIQKSDKANGLCNGRSDNLWPFNTIPNRSNSLSVINLIRVHLKYLGGFHT